MTVIILVPGAAALASIASNVFEMPIALIVMGVVTDGAIVAFLLLRTFNRMAAELREKTAALESLATRVPNERNFAEQNFSPAAEASCSAMVMSDGSGRIVMVNHALELLFGYTRDELMGQPVDMLVPARLRGRHGAFTGHPETPRMEAGGEYFGVRKDGAEFPIEVGLNPIKVGNDVLVLGVVVDVSERRRMERMQGEFVSTVSHELRTPLTSIAGSLGLLVGGAAGKLPDSATRLLTIALANSQRLVRLINDLLDIEKLESGQNVFDFKRADVQTLIDQAVEANRSFADSYNVRVRLDGSAAAGPVYVDPDRLLQVVTNLLSNAIKFSPAGGEVKVAIEQRSNTVRISVRDHGRGIPAEFKPHVFEKFAQARTTDARQTGGTGLGLSIVQQIVVRLGGTVWFDDAPGGGTIFHVDLPSWVANSAAGKRLLVRETPRPLVLHVDDDPDVLAMVAVVLGPAADVVSVKSLEEARRAIAIHPFDLAVLDIAIGPASGLNLLPHLRDRIGAPLPVIIFSAHVTTMQPDPLVRDRLDKSRASLDRLNATVRDCLRTRPLRKEMEAA